MLVDSQIELIARAALHRRAVLDVAEARPRTTAAAEDPFWTDVYRPALLLQLAPRAHRSRRRGAPGHTVREYLLEAERVCTGGTRADAEAYLLTVQERFARDAGVDRQLRFLMGVLKDITGAQPVRGLDFFVRLRGAVDSPVERLKYDQFLWNTVYFLKVDSATWAGMARQRPELQQAMGDTFSGDGTAAARVATFSSLAIESLFDTERWLRLQNVPMVSRVALWYRCKHPLHGVHADHRALADELSQLLRCVAPTIDSCETVTQPCQSTALGAGWAAPGTQRA